jgi:tetrahydromethanopterin S-methyltransferase subunit G
VYPAKENEFRKIKKKQDIIKEKTEETNKDIL